MSADDDDTRHYVIECSNALSEIADLLGQLVAVGRALAEAQGINVKHQLSCGDCGFPISSDRDVCSDCQLRAVAARAVDR